MFVNCFSDGLGWGGIGRGAGSARGNATERGTRRRLTAVFPPTRVTISGRFDDFRKMKKSPIRRGDGFIAVN